MKMSVAVGCEGVRIGVSFGCEDGVSGCEGWFEDVRIGYGCDGVCKGWV